MLSKMEFKSTWKSVIRLAYPNDWHQPRSLGHRLHALVPHFLFSINSRRGITSMHGRRSRRQGRQLDPRSARRRRRESSPADTISGENSPTERHKSSRQGHDTRSGLFRERETVRKANCRPWKSCCVRALPPENVGRGRPIIVPRPGEIEHVNHVGIVIDIVPRIAYVVPFVNIHARLLPGRSR